MSYIGAKPTIGNFQICDAISVVNGQAAYTMQVGSTNVIPQSANHMIVSLNGVIQKPNSSFTVSGSTITFSSNLATGDVIDFIQILGDVLDLGVPSDATVTDAKANFVSTSSAAGLQIKGDGTTDGTLQLNCSQNSHGIKLKSPAHSASASYTLTFPTTDGNADQFLQSNGSGVLTWADASADVVLLASSGNLTSGSRYNADNVFSSTYKSYKIIGTNIRFSADTPVAFVFRTGGASGSDSTQSRYSYVNNRVERNSSGAASALTVTDWNGSVGKICQDIESADTNKTGSFEFQVFDPYATKSTNWRNHTVQWDSSGTWIANIMGGGTYNYEAALTGIGIYPSSGNYVNGEIKIYGFK